MENFDHQNVTWFQGRLCLTINRLHFQEEVTLPLTAGIGPLRKYGVEIILLHQKTPVSCAGDEA
ncbi:hypothetical protein [Chryseolinea lacunae]|uniref:hypothetical protein n=1 Tax=Chryseolinea lacunae TaxID=2801331 RepID=UPI001F19124F|nr:hypothetical protein [Chryseolinea lacunae]